MIYCVAISFQNQNFFRNFGYLHPPTVQAEMNNNSPHHERQISAPVQVAMNSASPNNSNSGFLWSPNTTAQTGFSTTPRRRDNADELPPIPIDQHTGMISANGFLTSPRRNKGGMLRDNTVPLARQRDRLKSRSFDDLNNYMQMSGLKLLPEGSDNRTFEMDDEIARAEDSSHPLTYTLPSSDVSLDASRDESWRTVHTAPHRRQYNATSTAHISGRHRPIQYSSTRETDLRKTKSNPSLVHNLQMQQSPPSSPTKSDIYSVSPATHSPTVINHGVIGARVSGESQTSQFVSK